MKLDRNRGAMPLYKQLSDILMNLIEDGVYKTGDIIPSEKQLSEEYSVSRITTRQALSELTNKDYIEPMRGIGTVVTYGKIKENYKNNMSLTEEMRSKGIEISTSFCRLKEIKPNKSLQSILVAKDKDKVYELIRVRCFHGIPFVVSYTYLKNINTSIQLSEYRYSLYNLLKNMEKIEIVNVEDILEATSADDELVKFLDISKGTPLFKRKRKGFDEKENIIEYSISYYVGDRYSYVVNLRSKG